MRDCTASVDFDKALSFIGVPSIPLIEERFSSTGDAATVLATVSTRVKNFENMAKNGSVVSERAAHTLADGMPLYTFQI